MRIRHALRALALVSIVAASAGVALAQLKQQPKTPAKPAPQAKPVDAQHSPLGHWRFSTPEIAASRCTISGDMSVFKAGPSGYACKLTVFQTCTAGAIGKIRTSQSCGVSMEKGKLKFASHVDKIDSVDPPEIMEMVKARYAADNFLVQMNAKGDQMDGMFISLSEAPVTFQRVEDPIS